MEAEGSYFKSKKSEKNRLPAQAEKRQLVPPGGRLRPESDKSFILEDRNEKQLGSRLKY
jgi:hypothetical protein